jgi:hypothetical protein
MHPYGNNTSYRCNKKPRPEPLGYFRDADRVAAYEKCAQAIQLRTRIMPEVFAGDPTSQSIGGGIKVRTIQWGSDVFVVANFDASATQTVTLPAGAWYDYYGGGTSASGTITLQAGELKIFTGHQVELPVINKDLESMLPIEMVESDNPKFESIKFMQDGQLFIRRGAKTYTITGQLVNGK